MHIFLYKSCFFGQKNLVICDKNEIYVNNVVTLMGLWCIAFFAYAEDIALKARVYGVITLSFVLRASYFVLLFCGKNHMKITDF